MLMLFLFSSCSKPAKQNFYFYIVVFVKIYPELFQPVSGGGGVTFTVLGGVTLVLLKSLVFVCRFFF